MNARKTITSEQIRFLMERSRLEFAANREYERGRYPAEAGGPALAKLNAHRRLAEPETTHDFDLPVCP